MRTPDMRTSRMRRSLLVLFAVLALIATSCGGSSADSAAVASDASDATPAETADEPVEASLVATTVTGEQIDFGSLEGQDVVLWFWAPW